MSQRYQAGIITASYNGLKIPDSPTIGTAITGASTAIAVAFTPPVNVGGGAISSYTVTASPSGITGTGASSPVTVSGLTNGTAYTFTVIATNAYGSSLPSSASNSVTPLAAPVALPVYVTQGVSSYISSPTGVVNGTAYKLAGPSSNVGLGSTTTLDSHTYHVSDTAGNKWYIAANWGYGAPTRWGGVNRMGLPGSGASTSPAYTTADGIPVSITNLNGIVRSGTSANTILVTNDYTAANTLLKPGSFQFDAVTYSNSSGAGYANWYADGNKAAQTYPTIVTNAFTNWNGGANVQTYDGIGQGSDDTGFVWWRPPLLTNEVMIDFGNNYNNLPCRLFVWNNNTGTLVLVVNFGNFGDINETAGAINDPYTRTIIIKHTEGFVYFLGDGDPTIAGSHYYLYR